MNYLAASAPRSVRRRKHSYCIKNDFQNFLPVFVSVMIFELYAKVINNPIRVWAPRAGTDR
jgi:hypothetical protein